MEAPRYRVSELARICGVNPRTIDYYTTNGLITPVERSSGGHRFYGEDSAQRIGAIKFLQSQGFTLESIREKLNCPDASADLLPRVENLCTELKRLEEEVEQLGVHLALPDDADNHLRKALQLSVAGAATYALALAQELMTLMNQSGMG